MFAKYTVLRHAALLTVAIPLVLAQTFSDCTCPLSGGASTTTIFYDPNTVGLSSTGAGTGTGAGTLTTLISSSNTGAPSSSPATSAPTGSPSQAVANLNSLTAKSQALQAPANSITLTNGLLLPLGQGPFPQIIAGFADIVATGTAGLASMRGMDDIPAGAASDLVFDAFRGFVVVHQQLLNILIGKAGLFNTVPFAGAPVAAALRGIESIVDALAFFLIDTVQGRTTDFQSSAGSLGNTIDTAIGQYSGANPSNVARL